MTVQCRACGRDDFEDYTELAIHIQSSKKGHRKGKIWASKYLLRVNQLNQKKEYEQRVPLTEEEKENKRDTRRELSGQMEVVNTYCPRCKTRTRRQLEIEFTRGGQAWGIKNYYFVLCQLCAR
jgi:GTP cyclohydrolase FolE2